jgi:histidine triad (HIT) family protein
MTAADDCLFCKIAARSVPAAVVYESEDVIGFKDINPQAPIHILLAPKKHVSNLQEVSRLGLKSLDHLFHGANDLAREYKVHESGYRVVINCKKDGGQTVDHLHLHLLGGRPMHWPPG